MSDVTPRKFLGMTPRQTLVIGALVSVLIAVLVMDDSTTVVNDAETITSAKKSKTSADGGRRQPKWPEISLEQALAHDPFQPLDHNTTADDEAVDHEAAVEIAENVANGAKTSAGDDAVREFQLRGVSMIYRNSKQTCAVIGDRVVHEGDVIDGVRIVAITNREVVVEPVRN